jgi:hypothetical protein
VLPTPSFSILINGSPFGHFAPKRGLRQGDPLSPFLFILGSEALSRLLLKQESLGLLKGISISRNNYPISHLLFADDLIIFAKATSAEASVIKGCLDNYCRWSGQAVNISKSTILFSKNTASSSIHSINALSLTRFLPLLLFIWVFLLLLVNQKRKLFNLLWIKL